LACHIPDFGEGVAAIVIGQGDEPAMIAECRKRLAAFKTPKRIVFVDELPRNAMGKVQKNVLRETYTAPSHASASAKQNGRRCEATAAC